MKTAFKGCLLFALSLSAAGRMAAQTAPQLGKNSIKEVIAAMTLEEKAKLVVGNGFSMPPGATPPGAPPAPAGTPGAAPAPNNVAAPPPPPPGPMIGTTQQKVPGAAGTTFIIPRLGIPTMVLADGPAGVRISPFRNNDSSKSYYATAWPVGTLLASSWDTALIKKVGESFGNEVREYGVDILLAPGNNIHRNPLGGRNFEYYSEDPLVSGMAAASIINGIQSNGVGTSLKHYAGNEQETNRNTVNTIVSERALREIYLKPFGIAVKRSQPWTVMSSYNYINGPYTSENYELLTTILRKEWGFKGFVMTDWGGGKDPVAQMKAGNDLIMPGQAEQTKRIISAVEHDSLDIKILDENVERILTVMLQTPAFKGYKFSDAPDLKAHAAISRKAATEGMILLKNDGKSLPLSAKKIALFGNTSYDLIAGGTGSGDVNKAYTVSIAKGLANAGYALDDALTTQYTSHIAEEKAKRPKTRGFMFAVPKPVSELLFEENVLSNLANAKDVAVITLGRNAGEGADRKLPNDFNISDAERTLIKNVADAFHAKNKKVIVVLNIGGVIETASWRDNVDAILLAWQPGLEGGNAVADILGGKVDPSGKLATTFPMKYDDVPSAKTFPGIEFPEKATVGRFGRKMIPAEVTYDEGVYVGYRYYNSFHVKPAYEFGYGLSYTDFTYSNLILSAPTFNNSIKVSCTVTNSGKVAGKEILQLYLSAPAVKMDKPSAELKAFAKTGELKPGASQTVTFTLSAADLASFDTPSTSWIAEAGKYTVSIGSSSEKIRFSKPFTLAKDIVTEKVNKVLVPQVNINELKKQ